MRALFIALLLVASPAFAQQPELEKKIGFEWSVHTGPLLPNQIEQVTEIMPMWGARVGFPNRNAFVEVGATSARAYGTSLYNGHISYRGDITVESLTGIFYAGLDLYHITPPEQSARTEGGGHIGAGLMTLIGDVAWFRADMKFNINPGTALYIGFGINFRLPEGQDAGAPQPQ
ncbi:MAG TPA: hypothetical protein VFV50_11380 [Bdellovibrionales bacterium]|nr:hypothetical protein [Bdellovibrionales bacterium]